MIIRNAWFTKRRKNNFDRIKLILQNCRENKDVNIAGREVPSEGVWSVRPGKRTLEKRNISAQELSMAKTKIKNRTRRKKKNRPPTIKI